MCVYGLSGTSYGAIPPLVARYRCAPPLTITRAPLVSLFPRGVFPVYFSVTLDVLLTNMHS